MHVAVTGGNGFLGKPTVAALGSLSAVVRSASRTPEPPDAVVGVYLDVADRRTWENLLVPFPPQRLIHLAWDHLDNFEDPQHYLETLPDHLAFLSWCAKNGISDITVAGTCLEYGKKDGEMREETYTQPVTAYGIAKDALRKGLEHAACFIPFTLKWARIFFVRGDQDAEKGVFKAIRAAGEAGADHIDLTWGEQLRDYLSRTEVGSFLARFCMQDDVNGVVNCCSGTPRSVRRAVEEYAREWPSLRLDFGKLQYRDYEPMAFWGSRQKMDRVISPSRPTGIISGIIMESAAHG
jgi:nucleoside-diphosphate-sugar epimerase